MKKDVYKLTNPQMSIYLTEQFTDSPINNIVGTIYFKKDININLLKEAVNLTAKNNQAMRTIIFIDGDTPMQYFKEFSHFDIEVYDFSKKDMSFFNAFRKQYSQEVFNLYEILLKKLSGITFFNFSL